MTRKSKKAAPADETPEQKAERVNAARRAGLEKARQKRAENKLARERAAAEQAAAPEAPDAAVVKTNSAELRERAAQRQAEPPPPPPEPEPEEAKEEEDEAPPESQGLRTFDDLAAKLRARDSFPTVEEVAREVELDTGGGVLPPPETNPAHNRGIRSEAEVPDTSDKTPRRLEDLLDLAALFAPGEWYIDVDRRSPTHVSGVQCGGIQRPIREPITPRQFADYYGGGNYQLILYGPPRAGAKFDNNTGQQRFTKYGKPVKFLISTHTYPTNVESTALEDDDEFLEDEDMRSYSGFSRRSPASQADAAMHRADLEHQREMEKRQEEREERYRREAQEAQAGIAPVLGVLQDNFQQQQETLRQEQREREKALDAERRRADAEKRRLEDQLAEARNKPSDFQAMADMLGRVLGNNFKGEGSKEALTEVRRQLDVLKDRHDSEVQRLIEKHASDMNNQRAEFDRQRERDDRNHRDDLGRAEQRVKEAEDRADKRVADSEQRAERELREVKDRAERELREDREQANRRYEDLDRTWKTRIDDLQRQHDRDMKMKDEAFQMRLQSVKDSYENRISVMAGEQTRLQGDVERARAEAESNKDIVGQVAKLKETAGLLGMSDGGGDDEELPQDWRGMLAYVGKHAMQNLPQIMDSAGQQVREMRSQRAPAQLEAAERARMLAQAGAPTGVTGAFRGRDGAPFQPTHQLAFGTEDGPGFDDGDEPTHVEPRPPRPPEHPGRAYAPVQPEESPPYSSPMQPATPPQPPPQSMVVAQPQPQPRPQAPAQQPYQPNQAPQQTAQGAPPPRAPAEQPQLNVTNEFVVQIEQALSMAFSQQEDPRDVAEGLVQKLGPAQGLAIARGLDPEDVAVRLMHMGKGTSPLVRPAGKRWLGEILAAIEEIVQPG